MKKFISILALLFTMTVTVNAMSYEQARQQALFLTDKMAYELNLTNDQYEAAYEINLDYLIGVNTYDDLYGPYWRYRTWTSATCSSTGSIAHTAPPATSIVRSTSATVCGTSASTHAIHTATTSTLTVLWCT